MIRRQNPDGTWTELTDEEFIEQEGQEAWDWINEPLLKWSEMTEGQKNLSQRMMIQGAAQSGKEVLVVKGREVFVENRPVFVEGHLAFVEECPVFPGDED